MSNSNRRARQDRDRLRAFARDVMDLWAEHFQIDGGDLQELGLKHGLLVEEKVKEPCGEYCACDAEGYYFPTECNRFSSLLTGDRDDPPPEVERGAGT